MQVLLTGFEPFGGSALNPSEQVARSLDGQIIAGARVCSAILPVNALNGPPALLASLEQLRPDAILCLGEAAGREVVSIERIAINLLDFHIPDNSGQIITDQPVFPEGPAAYFSTLPFREIARAIAQNGIPVELSLSAGTYLCNQVFYTLLHYLDQHALHLPAGFIHIPSLPEQVAARATTAASMSLATSLSAIQLAIEVIAASSL